jgi:hypothetical protein
MDDRNYYRMLYDEDLIEQARTQPTAELAVALADRLEAIIGGAVLAGINLDDIN